MGIRGRGGKSLTAELKRRRDCRIGLAGVEAALRGRPGEVFVILGSSWDRHGKLRLELLPKALMAEYESDRASYGTAGVVIIRASELAAVADRWAGRRLDDVPAADVTLLTEWPIYCRCWC